MDLSRAMIAFVFSVAGKVRSATTMSERVFCSHLKTGLSNRPIS